MLKQTDTKAGQRVCVAFLPHITKVLRFRIYNLGGA